MGGTAAQNPWAATVDAVADALDVDLGVGLSSEEVAARRERHGWNELQKEPATPLWRLVLAQFDDMLVKARADRHVAPLAGHPGHRA